MSNKETITINKNDLWKYSTFLLIAVVLIGGFFIFINKSSNTGNNKNIIADNGNGAVAKTDLSTILDNPNL